MRRFSPHLKFIIQILDNQPLMRQLLMLCSLGLILWSWFTVSVHQVSTEALRSSTRIAAETTFVCVAFIFYATLGQLQQKKLAHLFRLSMLTLAGVNSAVVLFQLLETAQCLPTNLNWIITDFWKLPINEWTRKPGLFNGVLTSALLSLFSLTLLWRGRGWKNAFFLAFLCIPLCFGARTFMVFLPLLLLLRWRMAASLAGILLGLLLATQPCYFPQLLQAHFLHRIVPTAMVIAKANPNEDYSTHDLVTHYNAIPQLDSFLLGNGEPRNSINGGKDPAISRWIVQAGIPALFFYLALCGMLSLLIARKGTAADLVLAAALSISLIKADMATAAGILSILLTYALLPPQMLEPCSEKTSRT